MRKFVFSLLFAFCFFLQSRAQVVINEIMYSPPGLDSLLEFIELHNAGTAAVDISGWSFGGITFTFPAATSLPAGGFVVVASNPEYLKTNLGLANAFKMGTGSGLTNSGEKIELKNAAAVVVDEVDYKPVAPWPLANDTGASMVLCDPKSDNSLPASWGPATTATALVVSGKTILCNPGAESKCSPPVVVSYPARSIAQMTTENTAGVLDSLNKTCELTGNVYGINLRGTNGLQFSLIDDTNNGIIVFRTVGAVGYPTVTEKDKIAVRGKITQFNGLIQMAPDTIIKVSSGNPLVTPPVVTKLGEETEGKLVRLNNVRLVDATKWTTNAGAGGFTVRAFVVGTTDTFDIRIDNDVDLYKLPAPAQPFTAIGIGSQFDNTNPFTSGYQLFPRYRNDISTLSGLRDADYSANVQMSPNPVADRLLIQTDVRFDRLRIFAADGRLLQKIENPDLSEMIPTADFAPGFYFAQFEKDGAVWATKFVKN
jgi:Lamin Tail Domain